MARLDFHIEFNVEIETVEEALLDETARRLRDLAGGHDDLTGASVALEELGGVETPYVYQARVVVYIRPDNVVAVEKDDALETALKGALDAVERQVRELRQKRGQSWQQPPGAPGPIETD